MAGDMTCPDCRGKGQSFALVDGPNYSGPMDITCFRCNGSGKVDPRQERWMAIGGTHRTWRIAQHESQRDCAARLGIKVTDLSAMEAGRADPERLVADTPPELFTPPQRQGGQ